MSFHTIPAYHCFCSDTNSYEKALAFSGMKLRTSLRKSLCSEHLEVLFILSSFLSNLLRRGDENLKFSSAIIAICFAQKQIAVCKMSYRAHFTYYSSNWYIIHAIAVIPAVSVRKILFPRVTGLIPISLAA